MTFAYVRDSLAKRGKASWRLGYHRLDSDGSRGDRQYKTLVDCATRTQALEKAALYLAELERTEEEIQGRRAPTLGAVASRIVEELYSSGAIEESTYAGYLDTMKHLTWIAEIPVDEIRREDVGDFVEEMVAAGYATRTVKSALKLVRRALEACFDEGLVERNVATKVKGPSLRSETPKSLSPRERDRLLALSQRMSSRLRTAVTLMLSTGMRTGEACALRWEDVDFDSGWISIKHAIGQGVNGRCYEKSPKSAASRRKIPLEPTLQKALRERAAYQENLFSKAGLSTSSRTYVLGDVDGSFLSPKELGRDIAQACEAYGIEGGKCRAHWLRHTFATSMIAAGVDVRTVSAWLGHSDPGFTLRTYVDLDEKAMASSVEKLSEVLYGNAAEKPDVTSACRVISFREISGKNEKSSCLKDSARATEMN